MRRFLQHNTFDSNLVSYINRAAKATNLPFGKSVNSKNWQHVKKIKFYINTIWCICSLKHRGLQWRQPTNGHLFWHQPYKTNSYTFCNQKPRLLINKSRNSWGGSYWGDSDRWGILVPNANHKATSLASPLENMKEEGQKPMEDDTWSKDAGYKALKNRVGSLHPRISNVFTSY